MHPIRPSLLAAACCAAAGLLPAQTSFISPVTASAAAGSTQNSFPWASGVVRRYQQIHSDITMAGAIKSLATRVNENTTNYTGTATLDLEMFMGQAATGYDGISQIFDNNYLAQTKTKVLTRKIVTLGPQGQNTTPIGVFTNMTILFDTPFPYAPTQSLIWEAVVYQNTIVTSFGASDADVSTMTSGTLTTTGTGCIATGRTAAMTQSAFIQDMGGALSYAVGTTNGPSSAPVVLSIGGTNPNIMVPGIICGGLYTDLLMSFAIGTTTAAGAIPNTEGIGVSMPNTIGGLVFYSQQHAIDPGLSEYFKLANSNGQQVTVPMPNLTKSVKVSRMTNNAGGATAVSGLRFSGSSIGHGLVIRFDF